MKRSLMRRQVQGGFSLIEVLVTLVILMLGLLGLVGLMVTSQRSQVESYQRVQALVVVEDMVNRINANRYAASCYAVSTLGTGATVPTSCTSTAPSSAQKSQAIADLNQWHNLLLGSAEKIGGNEAAAMVGARGCVQEVSAGSYQVSVAWQGAAQTFAPPAEVTCGKDEYGDEKQRRVITVPVRIAKLS